MKISLIALIAASLAADTVLAAGWRADGYGCYPNAKPPTKWSTEENVIWKVKLPQWSNASPVLQGDRIFICSEPSTIMCLSKHDGSILWQAEHPYESFLSEEDQAKAKELAPKVKELEAQAKKLKSDIRALSKVKDEAERKAQEAPLRKEIGEVENQLKEARKYAPPPTHNAMGYSSPTPACDGKNVFVVFGSGIAACHDIDGKKKWAKKIGRPTHNWGHSTSPIIVGNRAIIQVTDVLAFDIDTGDELWQAPGTQVFGSLFNATIDGTEVIVTAEGKVIDARDGKVLAEGLHKLTYNAPVVADSIGYFIENGGKAFKLSASGKPEELWKTEPKKDRYYGSPLVHDGLIYAVTQKGVFSVIDTKDGKVITEQTLGTKGTHYTSPTLAGDYIFVGSESGEMAVLKPGREPEKIGVNNLEKFRCSPVFEGTRMYLRGFEHLYCIGE